MKAFVAALALASSVKGQIIGYPGLPIGGAPLTYAAGAPLTYAAGAYAAGVPALTYGAAPFVAAAPAPIIAAPAPSQQFHSQDEFGNQAHGYSNINSAKHESGNAYTGVQGQYSYVDANGQLQTTAYVADGLGFRVQATNLPVAPVANLEQPKHTLVGPMPVTDTEEVLAAKAEFQAAFDEATARSKRSTPASTLPLAAAPLTYGFPYAGAYAGALPYAGAYAGALPYAAHGFAPATYGYAAAPAAYATYAAAPIAPVTYAAAPAVVAAAPAAQEATLTKIQNNPGHAVSYRID